MAGAYFHIPFCDHKCIYCDFYSVPSLEDHVQDASRTGRFLSHLEKEIEIRSAELSLQPIDTIFFGGGTPSLLAPLELNRILELARARTAVASDAEITIEANPGTVDREILREFRGLGINRLSIGVQSFHDDELRFLTRIHSAEQAARIVNDARAAGFANLNIDLMFGIPGQTSDRWNETLKRAIGLGPEHLSCYSLTIEPQTILASLVRARQVSPISQELDAHLYEQTNSILAASGFEQYEVSNYARPGFRCRHNLTYWHHREYLGFGPSAHSFVDRRRWWNLRSLQAYGEALDEGRRPLAGEETLTADQLMVEEIFLGLRSTGIDLDGLHRRHQPVMPEQFDDRVQELVQSRLALTDGNRLWLTAKGYMLCDELCAALAA